MTHIDRQKLRLAVKALSKRTVLVVGDIMLDRYVEGPPRFVSQEAPVVVIRTTKKHYKAGGAGNAAENIQALGGRAVLVGVVGNHRQHDDAGKSLQLALRRGGLWGPGLIVDAARPTTVKTRVMSQGQQLVRIDEESVQPISGLVERRLLAALRRAIPRVDAVLVSDYNKGVITQRVMRLITTLAKRRGIGVVVDPRPDHRDFYRGVDVITPNEHELTNMFGRTEVQDSSLKRLAKKLQRQLGIGHILLTRGADGMELISATASPIHMPTLATVVRDVSGAGDTVAATVVLGYGLIPWPELLYLSSLAAKISVGVVGTSTVTRAELLAALAEA